MPATKTDLRASRRIPRTYSQLIFRNGPLPPGLRPLSRASRPSKRSTLNACFGSRAVICGRCEECLGRAESDPLADYKERRLFRRKRKSRRDTDPRESLFVQLRRVAHDQPRLEAIGGVPVGAIGDTLHQPLQAQGRKSIDILRDRRQRGACVLA